MTQIRKGQTYVEGQPVDIEVRINDHESSPSTELDEEELEERKRAQADAEQVEIDKREFEKRYKKLMLMLISEHHSVKGRMVAIAQPSWQRNVNFGDIGSVQSLLSYGSGGTANSESVQSGKAPEGLFMRDRPAQLPHRNIFSSSADKSSDEEEDKKVIAFEWSEYNGSHNKNAELWLDLYPISMKGWATLTFLPLLFLFHNCQSWLNRIHNSRFLVSIFIMYLNSEY